MGDHQQHRVENVRMLIVLILTLSFGLVELVAGWVAGSTALGTDGVHMFVDFSVNLVNFLSYAEHRREKKRRPLHQWIAGLSGLTLIGLALLRLAEAGKRYFNPQPIESALLIGVAVAGLFINIACLYLLGELRHTHLNLLTAHRHILADSIGSVAVISAGVTVHFTHWTGADPLASLLILPIIGFYAVDLVRKAVREHTKGPSD